METLFRYVAGCIAVLFAVALVGGCVHWIWTIFAGKCAYCGSRDFVPDDGLYFYCNNCRRKF